MTTWGFIGSGNIGRTVAQLALAAGDRAVMSNSRGPQSLTDLIDYLGDGARAATPLEAAEAGDIVVVTVPLRACGDVPHAPLVGKTVIDTMNYYPRRDGVIPQIESGQLTSSQLFQSSVPGAAVVKSFNNIFFRHLAVLARPGGAQRSALPIAADSPAAADEVAALLDRIGYDCVQAGPLADSWRQEPDMPVYGKPYAADPDDWSAGARRADSEQIRAALAAAAR